MAGWISGEKPEQEPSSVLTVTSSARLTGSPRWTGTGEWGGGRARSGSGWRRTPERRPRGRKKVTWHSFVFARPCAASSLAQPLATPKLCPRLGFPLHLDLESGPWVLAVSVSRSSWQTRPLNLQCAAHCFLFIFWGAFSLNNSLSKISNCISTEKKKKNLAKSSSSPSQIPVFFWFTF